MNEKLSSAQRLEWLHGRATELKHEFIDKYRAGQEAHGGDLGEVPIDRVLSEGINESLDQLAYLHEIRRRMNGKVLIDIHVLKHLVQMAVIDTDKIAELWSLPDIQRTIEIAKQLTE